MSTIVIRNLPEHLHAQLKARAEHNHRSMNKEVVHLIEAGLRAGGPAESAPLAEPPAKTADASPHKDKPPEAAPEDGRTALRAALIKQADGSFLNVLGIEDEGFFETLQLIRAEAADEEDLPDEET